MDIKYGGSAISTGVPDRPGVAYCQEKPPQQFEIRIFGSDTGIANGSWPTPDGIMRISLAVSLNFVCANETSLLS